MSVASRTVVTNEAVEAEIFELLARRAPGASICPSEVARALASAPSDWRALMPQVREVAQGSSSALVTLRPVIWARCWPNARVRPIFSTANTQAMPSIVTLICAGAPAEGASWSISDSGPVADRVQQ